MRPIAAHSALLAFTLSLPAAALAAPVDLGVIDTTASSFSKDFWRLFGWGSTLGAFTDLYTFTLVGGSAATGDAVAFDWGGLDLTLSTISVSGGTLAFAVTDPTPGSFSFGGLGAGVYTLAVTGNLAQIGPLGYAEYTGSLRAVPFAVPEPASLALVLAALGLGAGVLRRRG